jgi:hypothetical protein
MRGLILLTILAAGLSPAQTKNPWEPLEFLLGTWNASSDNTSGSSGATTFKFDLEKQIVVRTNFAQYTKGQQAGTRHDDLMIIYFDPPGKAPRAIYFDSEGHTIRYNITFPERNSVVFESEPSQPGPRYRLSNSVTGKKFEGKFEIAEPGKLDYKPYLTWTSMKAE